jgi:hypothetical protein
MTEPSNEQNHILCQPAIILNPQKCKCMVNGHQCNSKHQPDSDYCGKHREIVAKRENVANSPKGTYCTNYLRNNCLNKPDAGKEKCEQCLAKDRGGDKGRRDTKRKTAIEYNKTHDEKICETCATKPAHIELIPKKICVDCHNENMKSEINRGLRNVLYLKIKNFKKSTESRKIALELTDEQIETFFKQLCDYCGKRVIYNGIDRIDSKVPYVHSNCAPACKNCNIMKRRFTVDEFLRVVKYLLHVKGIIGDNEYTPTNEDRALFSPTKCPDAFDFYDEADEKNKYVGINENERIALMKGICFHCKIPHVGGAMGIDRLDSAFGYTIENSVSCCATCNFIKNVLSMDEFYTHLTDIYNFSIGKPVTYTQKEKLLQLCERSTPMIPEKFIKNHAYHTQQIFTGASKQEILNIKPKLLFVERATDETKNIWNYYRRFVAHLNIDYNYNIAKHKCIRVLVKDETSGKYLGIFEMTETSHWITAENGIIKKMPYSMDIDICVAFGAFKTNYNGKKLIASLAFSKEVLDYYEKRYKHCLLGLTFSSLYETNTHYASIPQLKLTNFVRNAPIMEFSNDAIKFCCEQFKVNYTENLTHDEKVRIICKAFDHYDISKEKYFEGVKRSLYFGETHKQSTAIIYGREPITNLNRDTKHNEIKTCNEIFNIWRSTHA